ncbi:MAG: phenylalanine--tRNA ligase subunit beta, partial [Clostridia bacterium]|nr:phenylalanine--tRNA ligase subunit beta [Clostridia bacterium]
LLDSDKINTLLGTDIKINDMKSILTRLGMSIKSDNTVVVPTFRPDVSTYADLAEEIARLYGYNKIVPSLTLGQSVTQGARTHIQNVRKTISETLVCCGLYEIMTYSFISPKNFDKLGLDMNNPLRDCMVIKNPLGEDFSVMRTTTIPGMLKVLSYNSNRNLQKARFFEIGKTYHPSDNLAKEIDYITVGMYGSCDFYDIKGVAESVLKRLGITDVFYSTNMENEVFHKGRCADIIHDGSKIGILGQIDYKVTEAFDAPDESYILIMPIEELAQKTDFSRNFKSLPKYPSSQRDLSVVVNKSILSADLLNESRKVAKDILEDVQLFDMYTGGQIEEGYKSLSYAFTFRSIERTLEEDEVNKAMSDIINILEKKFDAKIRC